MSQVSLIVKLVAADGKRADLATAFSAAYPHVAKEDGTRYYLLHEDMGDANVLWNGLNQSAAPWAAWASADSYIS